MGGPERDGAGLYIHLPFCSAVCPYCDFAVRTGRRRDRERFLTGLAREIALRAEEDWEFDTLYLGGGTPSLMDAEELAGILRAVETAFALRPGTRVFLEANPEDVDPPGLRAWREMGVAFLSLGVQSFDEQALRFLVRRHTPEQARRSVEEALGAGFETVSLDLIYGLPGRGPEGWRRDLEEAVRLGPQHLSCYQLTIHEGTYFGRMRAAGGLRELPEETQAELFLLTHAFLEGAGYPAYEISNFALSPAHRSRHNRKYWDHTPYLGLGPGAHSYREGRRWWNIGEWRRWQAAVEEGLRPVAGEEVLGRRELALEALMLGMRRPEGVGLEDFRRSYGVDLESGNAARFRRFRSEGLVVLEEGRLRPTLRGMAVADSLVRSVEIQ